MNFSNKTRLDIAFVVNVLMRHFFSYNKILDWSEAYDFFLS